MTLADLASAGSERKRSFFSRYAMQRDHISLMMKEHKPPIRYRVVAMVKGVSTQVQATRELGADVVTIRRLLARH